MISSATPLQPVHFQQLNELLNMARQNRESKLKRASVPQRLLSQLEYELPKSPEPQIFRRLGKHTQLTFNFS